MFASQTVRFEGRYDYLYNTKYASDSTRRNILYTLYSDGTSRGASIKGCNEYAKPLATSSSGYPYCTYAHWISSDLTKSGTGTSGGIFCFSSQDVCWKMSGLSATGVNGASVINSNSNTNKLKGYVFSASTSDVNNLVNNYKNVYSMTITNDAFWECLRTCHSNSTWELMDRGGDNGKYERSYKQYCSDYTGYACAIYNNSYQYRCPTAYYMSKSQQGTVDSLSALPDCIACPTLPTRDGQSCEVIGPAAGTNYSVIDYCELAPGCQSYDSKGEFVLQGARCYY